MSLNVAYSYCINLTEQEKLDIEKQVRKNRFELKFAIFFPLLPFLPFPTPMLGLQIAGASEAFKVPLRGYLERSLKLFL